MISSKLIFPHASTKVGKPYAIASNWEISPREACRELIQNALDAHAALPKQQITTCCKVSFNTARINVADIPAIDTYRKALNAGIKSWRGNDSVSEYLSSLKHYSEQDEVEVLYVSDNGIGFESKSLEAVLAEGTPEKQVGSSGSFGIGHLTAFGLSGLQYIFYGSKSSNGQMFGAGHAILSSFSEPSTSGKTLRSNHGYYLKEYTTNFEEPYVFCSEQEIPPFLATQLKDIRTSGSVIAILGFKGFKGQISDDRKSDLSQLIREAIAENFALAICAKTLEVEVQTSTNQYDQIDSASIIEFLRWMASPSTGTKEQTREALLTLEAIETFHKGERGHLFEPYQDCEIKLRNKAKSHSVSIWRNGMLITRTHRGLSRSMFDNKKPFNGLLLLSGQKEKRFAHDLVKKAETPLHDKIEEKRLTKKKDKLDLRALFKSAREWMEKRATDSGGEYLDLFDEILLDTGEAVIFKLSNPTRAKVKKGEGDQPDPDENEKENGGQSTKPKRIAVTRKNVAQAKIQGRLFDNAYMIRIIPHMEILKAILQITRDNGQDSSCTGLMQNSYLDVKSAKLSSENDKRLELIDGNVRLGKIKKGVAVEVELLFCEPIKSLENIALNCNIGIEHDN